VAVFTGLACDGIVIFMEPQAQGQPVNTSPNQNINQPQTSQPLVKKIPNSGSRRHTVSLILATFVVAVLGITTGWFLSGSSRGSDLSQTDATAVTQDGEITEIGNASDTDDDAEGVLGEGGINGEGTHHLDRNAGPDKMVYLTSTVVDLQSFVGKDVQVWGQTIASEDAPWLMDVSKIKVVQK